MREGASKFAWQKHIGYHNLINWNITFLAKLVRLKLYNSCIRKQCSWSLHQWLSFSTEILCFEKIKKHFWECVFYMYCHPSSKTFLQKFRNIIYSEGIPKYQKYLWNITALTSKKCNRTISKSWSGNSTLSRTFAARLLKLYWFSHRHHRRYLPNEMPSIKLISQRTDRFHK